MNWDPISILAWVLALSSGVMAGVYLAFSSFIMRSLATLGADEGSAAMNAINTCILRSSFMPLFFGSTVVAAALAGIGIWQWGDLRATLAVAAGLTYVGGMFVVTAAFNVPLNTALANAQRGPAAEQMWTTYTKRWTRWNTLRAVASLLTLALCLVLV